jgi:hypothetical protein
MTGAPLAAGTGSAPGSAGTSGGSSDRGDLPPAGASPSAASDAGGRPLASTAVRLLMALLAALVAAAALAHTLPLPSSDPLRATLALLPVLIAAFYGVHRWGVLQGGRQLSRAGTAGELAALGLLLAAAFSRPALDLDHASEVLAAGLLLVLAHRLARQVPALRPLLGSRLGPRPSALFFWLPLAVYLAILPWSASHRPPDGDEPYNLLLTHSLAYDGDTDLANNYAAGDWRHFMDRPIAPQPGDPTGPHGELYSRHNALLPLALVPAYRLFGLTGAQVTMALMTAALAWLTLRLGRHYTTGRPGESLVAYAWVAFAPPLLFYSYQVWVEIPAALLAMAALDRILDLTPPDPAPSRLRRWQRWRSWIALCLPVLLLPLLKIRFILIAVPLVALTAWRTGRRPEQRRQLLALGAVLLALVGGILLYNQHLYSNPLKIHSLEEIDPYRHTLMDYLGGCLGLFYDCAFGLFGFAPLWMLLLPALALLLARRAALPVHLAFLTLPYLLAVAPRGEWYGGWSPPFRYALIALPLLGLALAPLLASRHRPGARALIGGLGAVTLALALIWVVMPGWTYNLADGRTYVLDHLSSRLGADLARFFPSFVRPRTATWLWPPLSLALVAGAWWLPGQRRSRRMTEAAGAGIAEPGAGSGSPGDRNLAAAEAVGGWPRAVPGPGTALAGIALALAAAAALPVAAARAPTRVIELEDPQVIKLGGHLYPDRWVIERTRYRGGWVLRVGDQVRAPVVAGGRRLRLTLAAELIRNQPVPFAVDIAAGDRLLAVWTPVRERAWEELSLGPFDWPRGAPLMLTAHGPHPPGALNGAVLDRIELTWE